MSEKACEKEMEDCKLDSRSQIYRPVFILAVRQEPPSITLRLGNVAGQLIQNNSFNRIFFFLLLFRARSSMRWEASQWSSHTCSMIVLIIGWERRGSEKEGLEMALATREVTRYGGHSQTLPHSKVFFFTSKRTLTETPAICRSLCTA